MAKATPLAELQELHRLVAQSLNQRITLDIADNIPTDAATLGAAIKFLKDNAVTADPADQDDLSELRDKLKAQAAARRAKGQSIVELATSDMQAMEA